MKKVFLTMAVAVAFAFGMTSCNSNSAESHVEDSVAVEAAECCEAEAHVHNCPDSTCAATECNDCTKKGTDECCKAGVCAGTHEGCAHEGTHEGCAHEGAHEGCQGQHEGCQHAK